MSSHLYQQGKQYFAYQCTGPILYTDNTYQFVALSCSDQWSKYSSIKRPAPLINWTSGTCSQGCTGLQSLVKCLDHRDVCVNYSM